MVSSFAEQLKRIVEENERGMRSLRQTQWRETRWKHGGNEIPARRMLVSQFLSSPVSCFVLTSRQPTFEFIVNLLTFDRITIGCTAAAATTKDNNFKAIRAKQTYQNDLRLSFETARGGVNVIFRCQVIFLCCNCLRALIRLSDQQRHFFNGEHKKGLMGWKIWDIRSE